MQNSVQTRLALLLLACLLPAGGLQAKDFHPLEQIRQAAIDFAAQRISAGKHTTIEAGQLDSRLRLGRCAQPLSAEPLNRHSKNTNLTVRVSCQGKKPWTVYVPVKVKSYIPVAVAARPLGRGIPVSAEDVRFEQREVSRLTNGYFQASSPLLGRAPKRTLPQGTVISPRDLDIQKVIRKGHRVTIVAEGTGISVRMPGKALEDAGLGQQLQVQNLSSNRTVTGTAAGPDTVEVAM